MSRNKSRLGMPEGSAPQHSDPPIGIAPLQELDSNTSSLSFTVPTEFVELPSKGLLYAEGHPLHAQSVVEIRHMTAKDEDILSSRALLKQGIAVERFLKSILIEKSINTDSLLIGDRNAILVAARVSGFGPEYDTKVICPMCFSHGRHTFNLEEIDVSLGDDYQDFDIDRVANGNVIITTPKTKVQVECQPLTGFHEKQLAAQRQHAKKHKLPDRSATAQLTLSIVSINGNKNNSEVRNFIENMPVVDSRYIRKAIEICTPNIEIRDIFECDECGASADMEVPFTTDFFWPR
jgi:hypothetical protein